jgi:hypothetical protein
MELILDNLTLISMGCSFEVKPVELKDLGAKLRALQSKSQQIVE